MTADPHTASVVDQLRRRERWLLALASVRTELLSGGPIDRAMTLVADQCAALGDADAVLILLANDDGRGAVRAASGPLADGLSGTTLNREGPWTTALSAALESPEPATSTGPARAA